jgi:hypothetical protein
MHYPSSSRFAVSSGLRTATSAFPVLSLPPDLSASAAGYATVLPVRVTRYHQPRVARDDGRRGVPRRGLSLLGWTVPTTTPEDRAEPATEVKHPPSFRFITPLSLRTPSDPYEILYSIVKERGLQLLLSKPKSGYFLKLTTFRLRGYHALWLSFPKYSAKMLVFYFMAYCKSA